MDIEELKANIVYTDDDDINQEEIDHACYLRLRAGCDDYGENGKIAVKLLDMVADLLGI